MLAGKVAPGEREHQHDCGERATGRAEVYGERAQPGEHGAEGADRGTARQAQHIGIGERIAQQHLHQRARQRKQAADGKRSQRARQAQLRHNLAGDAVSRGGERLQQLKQRQPGAAGGERNRKCGERGPC